MIISTNVLARNDDYSSTGLKTFPMEWKLGTCSKKQEYHNQIQYHELCCFIPGKHVLSWEHKGVNIRFYGGEAFFALEGHIFGDGIQDYKGAQIINILGKFIVIK